jgi:hypothetical protein
MRFSIRDLLWATVVAAMGLGWWGSYRAVNAERISVIGLAHRQRATLMRAKSLQDNFVTTFLGSHGNFVPYLADWSVLDEPMPER